MNTKKTKKARQNGTIEQRANGKWAYRFSYYDENGKRSFERGAGYRTENDARRAMMERRELLDLGIVKDSTLTVEKYLRKWIEKYCELGNSRQTTQDTTRIHIERYLIPHLGRKPLGTLTTETIEEFLVMLAKEGRTGRNGAGGLAPKTIRNIWGTLHLALEEAVDRDKILVRNPAKGCRLPKWKKPKLTVWDETQVETFLTFCAEDNDPNLVFWRLLLTTGLRRGELLGLHWDDVDLVGGVLKVNSTRVMSNGKVIESTPKTDSGERVVALDEETVIELARLKNRQEDESQILGAGPFELVATRADGVPIHPLTFTRNFQQSIRRAGLPVMRLHDGRHTSATVALSHGVPLHVVSGRLGHAKVSTTLDIYAQHLPSADRLAADAIADAFRSKSIDKAKTRST